MSGSVHCGIRPNEASSKVEIPASSNMSSYFTQSLVIRQAQSENKARVSLSNNSLFVCSPLPLPPPEPYI